MIQCSFCNYENEDDTAFCIKCKTDLTIPTPVVSPVARPAAFEPTHTDGDVPTLHLDQIPLVENLGRRSDGSRPACLPRKPLLRTPPIASAPNVQSESSPSPLEAISPSVKPHLIVLRGEKIDLKYPLYPGKNFLGRTDDKPVDVDLEDQEPPDRIWTSRQHAVIHYENGVLALEDLNSLNGTFVNRTRVHPGQMRTLQGNDIIQVGTVQLRLILG